MSIPDLRKAAWDAANAGRTAEMQFAHSRIKEERRAQTATVSTARSWRSEEAGSDVGATPNASGRPAAGSRWEFEQALYAWREARAICGPEFDAVMAMYDRAACRNAEGQKPEMAESQLAVSVPNTPRWAPSFCGRCGFPLNDAGECRSEADSGR